MSMTNGGRANHGLKALSVGTPDYCSNDQQTNLTDTLANLMHFARYDGLDFDHALGVARRNFATELEEELGDEYIFIPDHGESVTFRAINRADAAEIAAERFHDRPGLTFGPAVTAGSAPGPGQPVTNL